MSERARATVFWVGAVVTAGLLTVALVDLTRMDDFADLISTYYLDVGVDERRSYNLVSSVIFDYRGFDTMIEQLILFAAVVGATLLLRVQSGERERSPYDALPTRDVPATSGAVQLAGHVVAGVALFVGVYIILAVHVTPGGGFQSGVLIAGGLLAIYAADDFRVYDRLTPVPVIERIESIAAGLYVAVGVAGLAVAGTLLANIFPLGELGGLYAAGTIWVLNLIVGFEVTAGFVMLFTEFLQQTVLIRERAPR